MTQITANVTTKIQKSLSIDFDACSVTVNGITNMVESDDKQLIANMGDKSITIIGENLQVVTLDTTHNVCTLSGKVTSVKYTRGAKKQSLVKRIFK